MKVKWKQFAQRRKINLEMFKELAYEDYEQWCDFRKVEPVSKATYESVQKFLVKPPVDTKEEEILDVVTVSTHVFNKQQLRRMKKNGLTKICEEYDVSLDSSNTKAQLIEKLLSLNKQ